MFRRKTRERAPAALPAEPVLSEPVLSQPTPPDSRSEPFAMSASSQDNRPAFSPHASPPARNPLSHLPNIGDAARRPLYPGLPGIDRGHHETTPRTARPAVDGRKLIVGRDIELTGSIAACDTLVVEGRVDSEIAGANTIEIAAGGVFHGTAQVEHAEIAGVFEGSLTVNKTLSLARTGRIIGTVRYATLEVEAGGQIQGTAEVLTPARKDAE